MSDISTLPAPRMQRGPGTSGDDWLKRMLIVDDEETIRLALAKFLKSRGYDVHTADSGPAALAHLDRNRLSSCSAMCACRA